MRESCRKEGLWGRSLVQLCTPGEACFFGCNMSWASVRHDRGRKLRVACSAFGCVRDARLTCLMANMLTKNVNNNSPNWVPVVLCKIMASDICSSQSALVSCAWGRTLAGILRLESWPSGAIQSLPVLSAVSAAEHAGHARRVQNLPSEPFGPEMDFALPRVRSHCLVCSPTNSCDLAQAQLTTSAF